MAVTYEPISTTTLGSNQNKVTFSSIPSTYTDLVIIIGSAKFTQNGDSVAMYYNNESAGTNYSYTYIFGNGTTASSGRGSSKPGTQNYINAASTSATNPGTFIINVLNYANSTTNKTSITRASAADQGTEAMVNLWRNTAAITQIDLQVQGTDNFLTGTTFTLYGIKSA